MVRTERLSLVGRNVVFVDPLAMSKLISWCENPSPDPDYIGQILAGLTEADLVQLMMSDHEHPARIAWAEVGRRRKYADIEVSLVVTDDEVSLSYAGRALALHRPAFE